MRQRAHCGRLAPRATARRRRARAPALWLVCVPTSLLTGQVRAPAHRRLTSDEESDLPPQIILSTGGRRLKGCRHALDWRLRWRHRRRHRLQPQSRRRRRVGWRARQWPVGEIASHLPSPASLPLPLLPVLRNRPTACQHRSTARPLQRPTTPRPWYQPRPREGIVAWSMALPLGRSPLASPVDAAGAPALAATAIPAPSAPPPDGAPPSIARWRW